MTESHSAGRPISRRWGDLGATERLRLVFSWAFAAVSMALLVAGVFSLLGETFPSHVGASRAASGAPTIHFALCPGEEVTEVTVDWGNGHRWSATSTGSTAGEWTVGEPLPATFHLEETPSEQDLTVGTITVGIRTNQARWGEVFTLDEITGDAIRFDYETVAPSDFHTMALTRYPCDDPDGSDAAWRLSIRLLGVALLSAVPAAVMLHRPRTARPPL